MNERQVTFPFSAGAPARLDKFLVICLPEFSRSRIQDLIKEGLVTINGVPARKSGQMLEGDEKVQVLIPATVSSALTPEQVELDIVFENDDLMVVNKPAGMVVHPAAGHAAGTLVNAALGHAPEMEGIGGEQRPGVVHRLDKDTSGLILLAKNDQAHRFLQDQFRLRKVHKIYQALVDGKPSTPSGRIEAAIGRDLKDRKLMAIVPDAKGREAISEYRTLESFPAHTLLEVNLLTGRTHQIRVHMAFMGCPVAGDTVYGRRKSSIPVARQFLHAGRLTIRLPGEKQSRTFEAPLPPELAGVLAELRQNS